MKPIFRLLLKISCYEAIFFTIIILSCLRYPRVLDRPFAAVLQTAVWIYLCVVPILFLRELWYQLCYKLWYPPNRLKRSQGLRQVAVTGPITPWGIFLYSLLLFGGLCTYLAPSSLPLLHYFYIAPENYHVNERIAWHLLWNDKGINWSVLFWGVLTGVSMIFPLIIRQKLLRTFNPQ